MGRRNVLRVFLTILAITLGDVSSQPHSESVPPDTRSKHLQPGGSPSSHTEQGSRILVIPAVFPSHIRFFGLVGKSLMEDGHEVDIIAPHRQKHLIEGMGPTVVPYRYKRPDLLTDEYETMLNMTWDTGGDTSAIWSLSIHFLIGNLLDILESEDLWRRLEAVTYDLVIIDGEESCRLQYIIPYRLGVPHMTVAVWSSPWMYRVPALPSVQPHMIHGVLFPDPRDNSLWNRLNNLYTYISYHYQVVKGEESSVEMVRKFAPARPAVSLYDIYSLSEMWLVAQDTILLDHPRVEAPHYRYIGGLSGGPAKAITDLKLLEFADGADFGFIVVSFGSIWKSTPSEKLEHVFLKAFSQLKQRVIMRHDAEYSGNVPDNVLLQRWLPQNDLLGHPNVKLFISHGGNNGQTEALYHGVPMLILPFFADQFYNGQRISHRCYGRYKSVFDITSSILVEEIHAILNNKTYSETARRASRIRQNLPDAKVLLRFWVRHILEFGGNDLRPPHIDMPLWQFFMLDIIAIIVVVLAVVMCLTGQILKCCLVYWWNRQHQHVKIE